MIIIVAGVTMNGIFALLIYTGLAWKNGRHYDPTTSIGRVVVADLPAAARAFDSVPRGTRITAVDGQPVKAWDDITSRITQGASNGITFSFAGRPDLVIPLHRDALVERAALAAALEPEQPPVLGVIGPGSPASGAGFEVGDSMVAIDGVPVRDWADAVDRIQPAAGRALRVDVVRQGERKTITVTPRGERQAPGDSASPIVGRIGVGAKTPYLVEPLSFVGAVKTGADAWATSAGFIFRTLRGVFNRQVSSTQLGGPILIGQMAAQEAHAGLDSLLAFIALISVNLAVVNLVPIPILDGGALVLLAIEGVIGRPLPARLREAFAMIGLVLIVLLMVLVFKNDIVRLVSK
jgi:regulator of sigma E protease